MFRTIVPLLGGFMLLASCNAQPDIKSTYIDSPDGITRLELRDWGDGKELYLHRSKNRAKKEDLLLQFEICKNVSAGWSHHGDVIVAFDDIEATYMNTHSHGNYNDVGVVFCKNTQSKCATPDYATLAIKGCYPGP
jgi:hypothetical protein